MAKTKSKLKPRENRIVEIVGWYGAIATLCAYFLVSFEILGPKDLRYQLLNLTGAIGLGIICKYKRTYQPLVVNIIWSAIALLAIVSILNSMS